MHGFNFLGCKLVHQLDLPWLTDLTFSVLLFSSLQPIQDSQTDGFKQNGQSRHHP